MQVSLTGAKDKVAGIDSTLKRKFAATELGMPSKSTHSRTCSRTLQRAARAFLR
jgi:ubiquitin